MIDIIAECCSNIIPHLDNLEWVVDTVASTGATHLKIQMFRADHFPASEYATKHAIEFPRKLFPYLVELCHQRNLKCGASVFDDDAAGCVEDAGGDFLKLATREWGNVELLDRCVSSRLPLIRSYDALTHRYIDSWNLDEDRFTLMACIPQYPATDFKLPTSTLLGRGWSSHTDHWTDCIMAVARGVRVIEKHISFSTLDPEARWSLAPDEFAVMVEQVRWAEDHRS